MIIAYHAIFTTYGTWLPNDPRGSYSKEVYNQELGGLRQIEYGRQDPQPGRAILRRFWTATRPKLSRAPYFLDERTRLSAAAGFAETVRRFGLTVRACSTMNDHVHILVMRTRHKIEYLVGQFKAAATRALRLTQTPWTRGCWKVFINTDQALCAAASYIEQNPVHAQLPPQHWDFVTPLPDRTV